VVVGFQLVEEESIAIVCCSDLIFITHIHLLCFSCLLWLQDNVTEREGKEEWVLVVVFLMATLSSILSLSSLPLLRRHPSLSPFHPSVSLSFSRTKPRSPFLLLASSAHSFDDFTSKSKVPFFHSFIPPINISLLAILSIASLDVADYSFSPLSECVFYYRVQFLNNLFLISWRELFSTQALFTGAVKNN